MYEDTSLSRSVEMHSEGAWDGRKSLEYRMKHIAQCIFIYGPPGEAFVQK